MNTPKQNKLEDTRSIEEFMVAFGQPVRETPILDPSIEERALRGRLVLEEAFELVGDGLALLVKIGDAEPVRINPKSITLVDNPDAKYDPVLTLDACADLVVVSKGTGSQLGLPVDEAVIEEVSPSNMSKLGADGKPIYDDGGKILKGPNFQEPRLAPLVEKYLR